MRAANAIVGPRIAGKLTEEKLAREVIVEDPAKEESSNSSEDSFSLE
jgi:hypothetical protein